MKAKAPKREPVTIWLTKPTLKKLRAWHADLLVQGGNQRHVSLGKLVEILINTKEEAHADFEKLLRE